MSSINDIIKSAVNNVQNSRNKFDVEEWAERKRADREYAYNTQDEMAKEIVKNGEMYKKYLDVQSKFPSYSVGNALLVLAQKPDATDLRDADSWKKQKINFKGTSDAVIILEPSNSYVREDGTEVQGYDAKRVFDISDMRVPKKLNKLPYTNENLLTGILSMSPVKVEAVHETSNTSKLVNFNVEKRIIEVSEKASVNEMLQGLVREITSIQLLTFNDAELSKLKNESVAYMISKKYSISTDNFNFDRIASELGEKTPQDIKLELSGVAECYQILTDGIDRSLDIEPKAKNHKEHER